MRYLIVFWDVGGSPFSEGEGPRWKLSASNPISGSFANINVAHETMDRCYSNEDYYRVVEVQQFEEHTIPPYVKP